MTIGLRLGSITAEVGSDAFFHSFFSTVSGRLESEGWGSRFPVLLHRLYAGRLTQEDAAKALAELEVIVAELARLGPDRVIWDIEDRSRTPPWGRNISAGITSLANYFVTSTGRDLIVVLRECLEDLRDNGGELLVIPY